MEPAADPARHADALVMERMVLFSDAVYAIVITLMAIEIRLPGHHPEGGWTDAGLLHALSELQPRLLAYVISFAVVALLWTAHVRKYRALRAVDGRVLWLNLLQLMFVGLLPFFTSLLAEALTRTAIVIYAGNLVCAGLAGLAAWRHASGHPALAGPGLTPAMRRRESANALVMVAVFGLSIPLALWLPVTAMLSWILIAPALMLLRRRLPG